MSLILSIEASTNCGSVALLQDDFVIGYQFYNIEKSHSSLLHLMIEQLMSNAGKQLSDLDAIAVAEGPGSYTGLRIAVSAAKGLCFSLDVPLIAVDTLHCMAKQIQTYYRGEEYYLCPMIDARRMEVYATVMDEHLNVLMPTAPVIIDENSFKDYSDKKILFHGDGAAKCKPILTSSNTVFIDNIFPSASDVGSLALEKYLNKDFENLVSFEPKYLKEYRIIPSKK